MPTLNAGADSRRVRARRTAPTAVRRVLAMIMCTSAHPKAFTWACKPHNRTLAGRSQAISSVSVYADKSGIDNFRIELSQAFLTVGLLRRRLPVLQQCDWRGGLVQQGVDEESPIGSHIVLSS